VPNGKTIQLEEFPVFGPKVLAGIGDALPDTIADRAITIRLQRKKPTECVDRARQRNIDATCGPIVGALSAWAPTAINALTDAVPDVPAELDDRAADVWEALLAIADLAGDRWPTTARRAAIMLSTGERREDDTKAIQLLAGLRDAFRGRDRISSADLIRFLAADTESRFATWTDDQGNPQKWAPKEAAKLLKDFGIRPKLLRLERASNARGYLETDCSDAFARYLPVTGVTVVTPLDGRGRAS
jgi:hypothetical protein